MAGMFLSTEQSIPEWLAVASILRGWALAEQGQAEEGIAQIQQGLRSSSIRVRWDYGPTYDAVNPVCQAFVPLSGE